ncbi:hypothetical protein EV421DRAFT_1719423 [Armillaria borealis]|uniref:CxC2-like cysteine cluster KDZ transposase-associated domain-containing protein n=1 Tax=Armillaria borealis TaxID=47425 RepID=A0AA39IY17_9AGAR|nr:hypothetical protein EV421DRAFT_1719423 [Armillaria borealis]
MGDRWAPEDDMEIFLDETDAGFYEELTGEVYESRVFQQANPTQKGKRSRTKKRPHIIWKNLHQGQYLDEILHHEGRGDYQWETACPDCVSRSRDGLSMLGVPTYRCCNCFLNDLTCKLCCVQRHCHEPLHRIECWNGEWFEHSSLKDIGLHVQLNHTSMQCCLPVPGHQEFKVLHGSGIHHVVLDYCGCKRQLPKHVQLLRRGWFPASQRVPRTTTSFQLLEFLHLLSLCAKTPLYDFYRTLEKLTTNTRINMPKSRNKALMCMLLQWRHLKMLKRGGRGHVENGVETMQLLMCSVTASDKRLVGGNDLQPTLNLSQLNTITN